MPKVKMSQVRSGSEKVKEVFRRPMINRRKYMTSTQFTNDELVEIFDLAENVEYHTDKRTMYKYLIASQNGPFNDAVFAAYLGTIGDKEPMLNLLKNAGNISTESKKRWLDYAVVSIVWHLIQEEKNDELIGMGIDVTKYPYNVVYTAGIVRYANQMGTGNASPQALEEVYRVLDTMTEEEVWEWYNKEVKSTYAKRAVDYLSKWENTPSSILADYWAKADFHGKLALAEHPNMSDDLLEEEYQKTNDDRFMPKALKELFVF